MAGGGQSAGHGQPRGESATAGHPNDPLRPRGMDPWAEPTNGPVSGTGDLDVPETTFTARRGDPVAVWGSAVVVLLHGRAYVVGEHAARDVDGLEHVGDRDVRLLAAMCEDAATRLHELAGWREDHRRERAREAHRLEASSDAELARRVRAGERELARG